MERELKKYICYLTTEERSKATIEKYTRDIRLFLRFLDGREAEKSLLIAYKDNLLEYYQASSVNSMLAAVNGFLTFSGHGHARVKSVKIQRSVFLEKEKELTKTEYIKLVKTADRLHKESLSLILQTICSTGIRISELSCITAEAVRSGRVQASCKNKIRFIFIPRNLRSKLIYYMKKHNIKKNQLFITKHGAAVSRTNIWLQMKRLAVSAGVLPDKVYPHNLRHLFARTYYQQEKDIVKLSDLLGHSSIATTRIYTMTSGDEHAAQVGKLGLVL